MREKIRSVKFEGNSLAHFFEPIRNLNSADFEENSKFYFIKIKECSLSLGAFPFLKEFLPIPAIFCSSIEPISVLEP